MHFREIKWRNRIILSIIWLWIVYLAVVSTTLLYRGIFLLNTQNGFPSYTKLFDGLPIGIKGVLFVTIATYLIFYTWHFRAYLKQKGSGVPLSLQRSVNLFRLGVFFSLVVLDLILEISFANFLKIPLTILLVLTFFFLYQNRQAIVADNKPISLSEQFNLTKLETLLNNPRIFWSISAFILFITAVLSYLIEIQVQPDSYAYLQIAQRYAEGDFVVRGVWSPFISWLYALFMILGFSTLTSAKIVHIVLATMIVLAMQNLAVSFKLSRLGQIMVMVGSSGAAILSAHLVNADVIGTLFLILFWSISLKENIVAKPIRYGVLMGLLGGLSYLGKAYNFPAIIIYLFIWLALMWSKGYPLRKLAMIASITSLVMTSVALPWVIAIYSRYDVVTLTMNTKLPIHGPDAEGLFKCSDGTLLCSEPHDVLFPWEDHLPKYQASEAWSAFESFDTFSYQIIISINHLLQFFLIDYGFNLLFLLFMLMLALYWKNADLRLQYGWLFLVIWGYISGYLISNILQARYFFPIILLMILGAICLLRDGLAIFQQFYPSKARNLVFLTPAILLMLAYAGFAFIPLEVPTQKAYCQEITADSHHLVAPLASIEERNFYSQVQEISFYTQTRTYGSLDPERYDLETIVEQFQDHKIGSVLVEDAEIAQRLVKDYGYEQVGTIKEESCGINMIILQATE